MDRVCWLVEVVALEVGHPASACDNVALYSTEYVLYDAKSGGHVIARLLDLDRTRALFSGDLANSMMLPKPTPYHRALKFASQETSLEAASAPAERRGGVSST